MNKCLYIGDADEQALLNWLCENISPLVMTTKAEFAYFEMYHGDDDKWIMNTTDVSDVSSSKWDTITEVTFRDKEDIMYCHLVWGGTTQ
jgi:hypothetical protein